MRIEMEDVSWFTGGRAIVDGITMAVPAGTVTGLLGPNGSGKSTLLSIAGGLRKPATGQVTIGGQDVHLLAPRARARMLAMVEQQASTDLDLRVEEVVALGRVVHSNRWTARDPGGCCCVDDAMARTQVAHLRGRQWHTLSGGERQRVHLARALAQQPSVLLLDEPTNHLDLGHQLHLLRCVRDLGVTTFTALHDLELAAAFCDRVVVLSEGRLVTEGPVEKVLTADLVLEVFDVTAQVTQHPITGRPHLVWDESAVHA